MTSLTNISAILGIAFPVLIIILIWSLVWKGIALWIAARKKSLVWFILLLVVNTLGILEILYIFLFSKINFEKPNKKKRQAI